nr:serine hydrolase domain-containing protein [Catenulispora pinisilvae]
MDSLRSHIKLAAACLAISTIVPTVGATTARADVPSAAAILQAGTNTGVADGYPGVIGMIRDGNTVQYVSAGYGDSATKTTADPQGQFRIGSLTKAFTSAVVLQLEAEGKLSLDDSVEKWLPGVVDSNGYSGANITIRELLNHTSGLPDYTGADAGLVGIDYFANISPNAVYAPQTLVSTALGSRAPVSAPGATWAYANTNYVLAGMIIQAVTGNTPGTEITNRIIQPLGLTGTSFPATNQLTGDFLHGYNDFWGFDGTYSNITMFGAAGAIVSTLPDLSTFVQALIGGRLLPAAQTAELETLVPEGNGAGNGYGLGIAQEKLPCGKTVWYHDGAVLGYHSYWFSNADGTQQVLMMGNEYHGTEGGTKGQNDTQTALVNAYCAL